MGFDNNEMMVELFRSEVESHSDALSRALLLLEKHPEAVEQLVGMMRAAHSIKGAARIVGVTPAVEVAHIMEDCFVAAQRGELQLESQHVDLLLSGVDLLMRIAEETKSPQPDWRSFDRHVASFVAGVGHILKGEPIATAVPAASASRPASEVAASLNRIECERLRLEVLNATANQEPTVVFDLSRTSAIEPIGLAFLSACHAHLVQHGSTFQIRNPSQPMRALLSACSLGELMAD